MDHRIFISPDAGLWVWLVASIAIFAILTILVAVLWIRDRRPPRMALGWLGTLLLLRAIPIVGILCLLEILYLSLRAFVSCYTPRT
jgi:hypothetical protein